MKWFKGKSSDKASDTPTSSAGAPSQQVPPPPQDIKRLGDQLVKGGRYADAEICYRQVKESDAQYPGAQVMLGFVLKAQGRVDEAREVLERAVVIAAGDADCHYILATLLETTGPRDAEILHLRKAIELRPAFDHARRQLIVALARSGRRDEATLLCEQSIAALPNSAELHFYRSNLHLQSGDKVAAIASCQRALALNSQLLPARQSLSRLLLETDQFEQAEASYRSEIQLTPNQFSPYHLLGVTLSRRARPAEAIEQFKRAIELNPDSSSSYACLGGAYLQLDDTSEKGLALAQASFEKAVALDPSDSECHYCLGLSYFRRAQLERARTSFQRAIEANPNNARARWAHVMLWTPAFSTDAAEAFRERSGFGAELARFEEWWTQSDSDGAAFVGELQPFFLTYQEESNVTLLKQYGQICAKAMQRWLERQPEPEFKTPPLQRVRLGIVSADIRMHSNWMALIEGWLRSFDRDRIQVVLFSLSDRADAETASAREKSDVFISGPKSLSQWVTAIREQNCEVLFYPGIGLDPTTVRLASLRLAPVQMVSWGHPDTSGLPTIDYYLSAASLEPEGAQEHYAEKLILLPHLGNRVQPLNLTDYHPDFSARNINLDRPILICPGTPFKYQPAYDHVFPEIARKVPDAQLLFFMRPGEALSDILQARIIKTFETAGLNAADHVRFNRWLPPNEYHSLMRRADVLLDTIGFSGYNTAVQALECGLPLVTREGKFLRGRLASGPLRLMGLEELIAQTETEYVDLVCRLATDGEYSSHIRREIERRRPVLFDDLTAMGPFQDFLESVARPFHD